MSRSELRQDLDKWEHIASNVRQLYKLFTVAGPRASCGCGRGPWKLYRAVIRHLDWVDDQILRRVPDHLQGGEESDVVMLSYVEKHAGEKWPIADLRKVRSMPRTFPRTILAAESLAQALVDFVREGEK